MAAVEIARKDGLDARTLEQVLLGGDLSKLTPAQRLEYYRAVCESVGLNPLTKPFDYLMLNGKLTLYARKDATDQIRAHKGISIEITGRELVGDVYVVTARGRTSDGRTDESIGAVSVKGLSGDALANAYMKAETKAKRRVTLSLAGLGWLDETEISTIPDARPVQVDDTGEVVDSGTSSHDTDENKPASEKSKRYLFNIATKDLGWSKDQFLGWLKEQFGATEGLTQKQVSWGIEHLSKLAEDMKDRAAFEGAAADEQPF